MLPFLLRKKKVLLFILLGSLQQFLSQPECANAASAVSCLALWAAPNPNSTGRVPCHWAMSYHCWKGHCWVPSPVFLWNPLDYLHILCPALLQLVSGENEPFCARRRLSTDAKPLEGTSSAELVSAQRGQPTPRDHSSEADQLQQARQSQTWGAKMQSEEVNFQMCYQQQWLVAKQNCDLSSKSAFTQANSSICTDFGWEVGGKDPLAPAHIWADTRALMSVWQWENSYSHKWFYPWFLQLKSTTTYFLFWLHQTWRFKSLFAGLGFSPSLLSFFKLSAILNLF